MGCVWIVAGLSFTLHIYFIINLTYFEIVFSDFLTANKETPSIVFINSLSKKKPEEMNADEILEISTSGCTELLNLVQAIMKQNWATRPELTIITSASQQVYEDNSISPGQTAIRGFGRVVINEINGLKTRMVDMSNNPPQDEIISLEVFQVSRILY